MAWKKSTLRTRPIGGAISPRPSAPSPESCLCKGTGFIVTHGCDEMYSDLKLSWSRKCQHHNSK